jgi:hypothetical protein
LSGFLPCALRLTPCAGILFISNNILYLSQLAEMPIYQTSGIKTGELRLFLSSAPENQAPL